MSFFRATCPVCGEQYIHLFVGRILYSGHHCPMRPTDDKAAQATNLDPQPAMLRAKSAADVTLADLADPRTAVEFTPEQLARLDELLADDGFDV